MKCPNCGCDVNKDEKLGMDMDESGDEEGQIKSSLLDELLGTLDDKIASGFKKPKEAISIEIHAGKPKKDDEDEI